MRLLGRSMGVAGAVLAVGIVGCGRGDLVQRPGDGARLGLVPSPTGATGATTAGTTAGTTQATTPAPTTPTDTGGDASVQSVATTTGDTGAAACGVGGTAPRPIFLWEDDELDWWHCNHLPCAVQLATWEGPGEICSVTCDAVWAEGEIQTTEADAVPYQPVSLPAELADDLQRYLVLEGELRLETEPQTATCTVLMGDGSEVVFQLHQS